MVKNMAFLCGTSIRPDDELLWQKTKNLEESFENEGTLYNSMQF